MRDEPIATKSLIDQIVDETLVGLEGTEGFGPEIVKQLREIASTGDIKKAASVTRVIKPQ